MTALVEFVENALQQDRSEIMRLVVDRPGQLLAQRDSVLGLLSETWHGETIAELPALATGELRPVFGGDFDSLSDRGLSRHLAPGLRTTDAMAQRRKLEVQSLLLYAHSVAVRNPLAPNWRLVSVKGPANSLELIENPCSDAEFLLALYTICDTAILESASAVYYFTPPATGGGLVELREAVAALGRELFESRILYEMDQGRMYEEARSIYESVAFQIVCSALAGYGVSANLLVPSDLGSDVFSYLLTELVSGGMGIGDPDGRFARGRDSKLLDNLMTLRLPGVENIKLRDMAAIRDDDSFGTFRIDMRSALESASDELKDHRIDEAQAVIAEHMRAALGRLSSTTRRGIIADAVAADAVGWSVGAAVAGALAGWHAAVATLMGKAATELWRRYPSQSLRALRAHYVALSDVRVPPQPISRERLSGNEVPRLWGITSTSAKKAIAEKRKDAFEKMFAALDDEDDHNE